MVLSNNGFLFCAEPNVSCLQIHDKFVKSAVIFSIPMQVRCESDMMIEVSPYDPYSSKLAEHTKYSTGIHDT